MLVGTREPDLALARLTASYQQVVLKTGPDGARWARGSATVAVPAVRAAGPALDSTGAGDAFAAAYLAAARTGATPADALTAGCRTAASVVVRVGARPVGPVSPGSRR